MGHDVLIPDFLKRAVTYWPNKIAVIEDSERLTYLQFQTRVNQLSNMLTSLGIRKGDRVAYLAPNTLQMLEGFYGVMEVGAIHVPLNTRLIPDDYLYIINHCGAKVVMVDAELADQIESIKDELHDVEHFILLPYGEQTVREGWKSYEPLLKEFSATQPDKIHINETDLASILYTSGTTGRPKGVMHTHRSLYFNALNTIIHLNISDKDVLLHTLPLFHVNGWGMPFSYTAMGATHVMLRKVDPPHVFQLIETEHVSNVYMAPTVLNMLLNDPSAKAHAIHHHLSVSVAGSAPPLAIIKQVEESLKWEFTQVYGMTEAAPFITVAHIKSHLPQGTENVQRLKAKAGIGMINTEVKVVDDNGEEIQPNGMAIGEVIARGNSLMQGYWKQPEETAKAIKDGWYHTGDMATIDEEGYIEIVDRKKDIIISGGENISSIEVEGVIYRHPAVLEVAVIAIPHEKWGEVPHIICVVKEGQSLAEEELIQFCRQHLAGFKSPKSVDFVEELPKTASGKIQKAQLRIPYWKDIVRQVN